MERKGNNPPGYFQKINFDTAFARIMNTESGVYIYIYVYKIYYISRNSISPCIQWPNKTG